MYVCLVMFLIVVYCWDLNLELFIMGLFYIELW